MYKSKIILATDSFKGSINSLEICDIMTNYMSENYPRYTPEPLPVSDGGEGFLDVLAENLNLELITEIVTGPLGQNIESKFGIKGNTAYLEMAQSSGLQNINKEQQDPLHTTTYGLGELINAAINQGANEFVLGIGGSATCDGGAGMAQALGAHFIDKDGNRIEKSMTNTLLKNLEKINLQTMQKTINNCTFQVACDVNNPLLGKNGAIYTYAPQKGAREQDLSQMEKNMKNLNRIIEKQLHKSVKNIPGAGAAGGLGAGLVAFLDANLKSGSKYILDILNFPNKIKDALAIITGEGQLDTQTEKGKIVSEIIKLGNQNNSPVYLLCGSSKFNTFTGVENIIPLNKYAETTKTIKNPARYLEIGLDEIMQDIECNSKKR